MNYYLQVIDNQKEKNISKLQRLRHIMKFFELKDDVDLANKIKISQGYISEIFSQKKNVPRTMGQRLEDYLNVRRVWFDYGEGEMLHETKKEDGSINKELTNSQPEVDQKLITTLERTIDTQEKLITRLEADNEVLRAENANLRSENNTLREKIDNLQTSTGRKERHAG